MGGRAAKAKCAEVQSGPAGRLGNGTPQILRFLLDIEAVEEVARQVGQSTSSPQKPRVFTLAHFVVVVAAGRL